MPPGAAERRRSRPERWRTRPDLAVGRVGGQALVYDPAADALHRLDAVGTAIWDRLDGRPVEDLVAALGGLTGRHPAEIADRLHELVAELRRLGLLVPADGPVRARPRLRAHPPLRAVPRPRPRGRLRAAVYSAHGMRFAVESPDRAVRAAVHHLLAALGSGPGAPEHVFRLEPGTGGELVLSRDGELVGVRSSLAELLDLLAWEVNQRAIAAAGPDRVLLHAAAAAVGGAGVLLCGASGAGKSTLVGQLVRAGAAYLTDELVAVDRRTGLLLGYPRALSLRPGSEAFFPGLIDDDCSAAQVPAARLGAVRRAPVPARWLLLLERAAGTSRVDPVHPADALSILLEQTFGWKQAAADTLPLLATLVAGCECWRVTVGDDRWAGPLVQQLVLVGVPS